MTVDRAGHVLKNAGGQRVKSKLEKLSFAGELGGSKLDLGNMFVVFVTTVDVAAKPAWRHKQKWVTEGSTETRVSPSPSPSPSPSRIRSVGLLG